MQNCKAPRPLYNTRMKMHLTFIGFWLLLAVTVAQGQDEIPCVDVDPRGVTPGCVLTTETSQCIQDLTPLDLSVSDRCEIARRLYCPHIPCYTASGCDAGEIEAYLECTANLSEQVNGCDLNCGDDGNGVDGGGSSSTTSPDATNEQTTVGSDAEDTFDTTQPLTAMFGAMLLVQACALSYLTWS